MERETPWTRAGYVRIKPMMRGVGAGLLAILCCGMATAQSAGLGFTLKVPAGSVTETDGKPIHGARVWVRVEATGCQYPRARRQIRQKQRLPVVFTSRDGSFVLPLTRAQRLLSTPIDGYFSLVVEKAGYQTWIEPMGGGLRGYLGSRVVLRRHGPEDRFQVRVRQPVPGMKLLVRRRANPGLGNQPHVNLTEVVDVPAGGMVDVAMALVPSPRAIMGHYSYLPLSRDVQLLYPGRSSAAISVQYGQDVVDIKATRAAAGEPAQVVANDTRPVRGVRGLFHCPDGSNRWFSLPDARLPRGSILQPRAVTAEGCVVQTSIRINQGRLVLQRAPVSTAPRSLRIVDQTRKPISGAMVGCYALDSLRDPNNPWYGPGTAWRVRRANDNGEVLVPDVVDRVPSVLMVQAPGYRRNQVLHPRSIVGRREVRLVASPDGGLELTLHTHDGSPLAGVYLRFPDNCYNSGGILDRIPRTDENGIIRLDHVPRGRHSVQIIGEGIINKFVRVDVKRGGVARVQETVEAAPVLRGITVSDDGSRVPFASIQPYVNHRLRNLRPPGALVSDSQGRFVLHGVPEQAITVQVRSMRQQFRWVNHPMDLDGEVSKIPVTTSSLLLMKMPKANPVQKVVTYVMNRRRQVINIPSNQPTVATLVRWAKEDNVSLFFRLAEGPPLRIDSETVASAGPKLLNDGPGVAVEVLGERPVTRRVPVQLDGGGGLEGDRLRLEISNVGGGQPYVYEDLGLGVTKDKDGRWWFLARDDGAYHGRLLHPQLLPVEFDVPAKAKNGEEKPIRISLKRGVPLTFSLHLGKQRLNKNSNLNVRLRNQARRNYVLYWHQPVGRVAHEVDADNVMRLRCPVALKPGKINVNLRIHGTRVRLDTNLTVVKGQEAVVLEFKNGKAKQRPPKAQFRLGGAPRPVGPPKAPAVPLPDSLKARQKKVDALQERLDAIKKQLGAARLGAAEKARLEKMVATMTRRLDVLKRDLTLRKKRLEKFLEQRNKQPAAPDKR